jgi:hypothetical protein
MSTPNWLRTLALALIALILAASPAAAAQPDRLRAVLDGQPATVSQAAEFYCHDLRPGVLECYTDATDRDNAVANILGNEVSEVLALGSASTGYVIVWADPSYAGASAVLSQDYANLGSIGWNDRISSYKVYTTYTGAFYDQANYQGLTQYYCCFSQVSYVGASYNDIFSSFNLP